MSGLEPLAALGLICNIFQLVELGFKTTTLCRDAYQTGQPDPDLSRFATNLAETSSSLGKSLETLQGPLTLDDERLLSLARECQSAEANWRKETPQSFLLLQQHPRRRDRIRAVFKGAIKKPELNRLESQLRNARASLETDLLVGVLKRLDLSTVQTSELDDKLQDLIQVSSKRETDFAKLLHKEVCVIKDVLTNRIQQAETSTTGLVATELSRHEFNIKTHIDEGRDALLTHDEATNDSRERTAAYHRLLRSVRYPGMEDRKNDIRIRHKRTCAWLFEENASQSASLRSDSGSEIMRESDSELESTSSTLSSSDNSKDVVWDSFVEWLRSPEHWYWISGRPGTGKSVLMKFIISGPETMDELRKWQPDVQMLLHFFWKPGNTEQSNFKGFLCSVIYQLCVLDQAFVMAWLQHTPDWRLRARPGDWDLQELRHFIVSYFDQTARPFCLFLDGLDEFFDHDGVGVLIDFLEKLQRSPAPVKICVSSRPEPALRYRLSRHQKLRMQDLTRRDIRQYTRAVLRKERTLINTTVSIDDLVNAISSKAEGVFLWAVLVTRSIVRGIIRGDSRDDIQQRLSKTPKELYDLYREMWTRHGEDIELHRESSALLLSILVMVWQSGSKRRHKLNLTEHRISIFELMVAWSDDLWFKDLNQMDSLTWTDLEQRCKTLSTKVEARSAGLLEVVNSNEEYERLTSDQPSLAVLRHNSLKVQAVHRTVFDFLVETDEGERIMQFSHANKGELFLRIFRACLLRDCLWPDIMFGIGSPCFILGGVRTPFRVETRLRLHAESLSHHADIIWPLVLNEMLEFNWNCHLKMTKDMVLPPEYKPSPTTKLDYLLIIAEFGFYEFVVKELTEWDEQEKFHFLHQVLVHCSGSIFPPDHDFPWSGRHDLIAYTINMIYRIDKPCFTISDKIQLSNSTISKMAVARVLLSNIVAFRVTQQPWYDDGPEWNIDRVKKIMIWIKDLQHEVVCSTDSVLILLRLKDKHDNFSTPLYIGLAPGHGDSGKCFCVEVSMLTLIRIFLRQVARQHPAINIDKEEQALGSRDYPQTINATMLRQDHDYFFLCSSADQSQARDYCQSALLPDFNLDDEENCDMKDNLRKRGLSLFDEMITRCVRTDEVEKGCGPDGMIFHLCDSCTEKEKL